MGTGLTSRLRSRWRVCERGLAAALGPELLAAAWERFSCAEDWVSWSCAVRLVCSHVSLTRGHHCLELVQV